MIFKTSCERSEPRCGSNPKTQHENAMEKVQVNKLKALGCDEMQGFLLGKPLAADAFGELLRGVRA